MLHPLRRKELQLGGQISKGFSTHRCFCIFGTDQGESPGARPRVPLQGRFTLVETSTAKLAKVHNDQEN